MAQVAVTGAGSAVGRTILPALRGAGHTVTAYTHRPHDDLESELLEVTDSGGFATALQDHDVVIHLAGKTDPEDPWSEVLPVNVEGTYNCFEAAIAADLDRVVFASSNHTVQLHNAADPADPAVLVDRPRSIPGDAEFRPDSSYGLSKAFGELMGRYYADRYGIEVINVRIGWLDCEALQREIVEDGAHAAYARAMYLSERDCRDALRKSVDAEIPRNPLTVNLVSRNQDRYLSITEAMRGLGYAPKDDSSELFD